MKATRAAVVVLAALTLAPLSAGTAQAQLSGKPGKIAFIRGGDVYTAAANGTGVKRLTATPAVESTPKWSPNGQTIAFVRGGWVWTVPGAGGTATKRFEGSAPSWSPDGSRIAYIGPHAEDFDGDGEGDCSYDAVQYRSWDGFGRPTVLDDFNSWGCTWLPQGRDYGSTTSWSPNSSRVLYAFNQETAEGFSESTYATSLGEAGPGAGSAVFPSWPGFARVPEVDYAPKNLDNYVFATNAGDPTRSGRLWVYNRAGTYKKQASPDKDVRTPVYSPTGTQVLYAQHTRGQQPKLRLVTLPSSTPKTVLTNASQPDWQRVQ